MKTIELLQHDMQSDQWGTIIAAADCLVHIGDKAACDALCSLLPSRSPMTRNAAAIALRQLGDNEAVQPLIHAIQRLSLNDDRDTLVWALQTLDCSKQFAFLFDLALSGTYIERVHSVAILEAQSFRVFEKDLLDAQNKLDVYVNQQFLSTDAEELTAHLTTILDRLQY